MKTMMLQPASIFFVCVCVQKEIDGARFYFASSHICSVQDMLSVSVISNMLVPI